jgi:hypothetical protein
VENTVYGLKHLGCRSLIMGVMLCMISFYYRFDREVRQAKGLQPRKIKHPSPLISLTTARCFDCTAELTQAALRKQAQ